MAEMARWRGHVFEVSPTLVRSFTDLTIKASSDTEDKETGKQKYVKRKNGEPMEVSMTVMLSALTGCSVREEALMLAAEARGGFSDFLYVGGKKLLLCQLMLTEASVTKTEIAPGGTWVSCEVKLTFKQASPNYSAGSAQASGSGGGKKTGGGSGGSSGGSSRGSTKKSVKKKNAVSKANIEVVKKHVNIVQEAVNTVLAAKKNAGSTTERLTAVARQSTSAGKIATAAKKVVAKYVK